MTGVWIAVVSALSAVAVAVVKYHPKVRDIRDAKKQATGVTKREFDGFVTQISQRLDSLDKNVNRRFDEQSQDIRELRKWLHERY